MHPGGDCIGCHAQSGEGPRYSVAGTVMGDLSDADDCYGVEGVTVRVTDANDVTHEVVSNAAGNFFMTEHVPAPYTVELDWEGGTSAMLTPQSVGSCASCHTAEGANAAPGRTVAP
jgi:cytochrome c553